MENVEEWVQLEFGSQTLSVITTIIDRECEASLSVCVCLFQWACEVFTLCTLIKF